MKKEKADLIIKKLSENYFDARPALIYNSVYELLIAVILSAQCTDERVNKVTANLFKIADTPQKMVKLKQDELEKIIYSCGFYKNKASHILISSKDIIERYQGNVPDNLKDLNTLAGVGRKTANVVYSVGFSGDAIAVDTHVFRVSNRLGLASSNSVLITENQLMDIIDKDKWSKSHHYLIYHGRQVCKAQNFDCNKCFLNNLCEKHIK
jgi:endonuclease-3